MHIVEPYCCIGDSQYHFQLQLCKLLTTSPVFSGSVLYIPGTDLEMISFNFFSRLIHHNSLLRYLQVLSGNTILLSLSLMSSANLIRLVSSLSKSDLVKGSVGSQADYTETVSYSFIPVVICNDSNICP